MLSTLPISYASLLSRTLNHTSHFDHQITLLDSRTRKVLALRNALDHSNLDGQSEDSSIARLEAVLETKSQDLTKGRGAPWRRDNNAGRAALESLMQICGVPMRGLDQSDIVSHTPVRVSSLGPSRDSSLAKDHTHVPPEGNIATATPTATIPARSPEPLPTAAADHVAHVSALVSLDTRLAQIGSTQDTPKNEAAPSSIITNTTFDVETDDFESKLRALEGELEMIDQDASRKLEEVVEIWEEYAPVDQENERYRFGGGKASQNVAEPLFEV